jgi:hypothetical protein
LLVGNGTPALSQVQKVENSFILASFAKSVPTPRESGTESLLRPLASFATLRPMTPYVAPGQDVGKVFAEEGEDTLRAANVSIRQVHRFDIPKLHLVLTQMRLSTDGLLVSGTRSWLAEGSRGQPVGVAGLELGQDALLLPSAAISPALQGEGLGTSLVQPVLGEVLAAGYPSMDLFSTGAG